MDRGAGWATVRVVADSRTRLSDFTLLTGLSGITIFSCLLFPLTDQDLRAPVLPFYGQSFFSIPTFPSAAVSILFVFNNGSDG